MTRRARRAALAAVAVALATTAMVLDAAPAQAATTTTIKVPGASMTRTDATAGTTLVVKATVARLDLWCSAGKLVVDRKATSIPCNRLLAVTTTGLVGDDTVSINATGFGSSLPKTSLTVKTGAGNDHVSVRHRGSLVVYAGTGNDTIGAGLASGAHPVSESLYGEDGNDALTNLGFITATPVLYDWNAIAASKAVGSTLRGGPGADTITGDDTRWSDVAVAANDVVDLKEGPALVAPDEGSGVAPSWTYQVASGSPWNPDTLRYGRATSLAIRCGRSSASLPIYAINGLALAIPCSTHVLQVHGTDRAEALDYDQALANGFDRYGMGLVADLAGGDDTASVRHPMGSVSITGGSGADRISSGISNRLPNAEYRNSDTLDGGPGNDQLVDLGFLDPNPPQPSPSEPEYAFDFTTHLIGGEGADALIGAATNRTWYDLDVADVIADQGGLATVSLTTTTGADQVALHLRPTGSSQLDATAGGRFGSFALPPRTTSITLMVLGGDDTISVDGASPSGTLIEPGAGSDYVRLAPLVPATRDLAGDYSWMRQPGYGSVGYNTAATERFDFIQAR